MIAPPDRERLRALLGRRALFDEPLARHTSLGVGGPADALLRPRSRDELAQLAALARESKLPLSVIGKGFNTLVRDGGVRGLVVDLRHLRGLERTPEGLLRVEAGVTHSSTARYCGSHGLSGLEFTCGIPGSVGGWLRMNAGVPQREVKDVLETFEWFEPQSGRVHHSASTEFCWRYRGVDLDAEAIVLSATFRVEPDDPSAVRGRVRTLLRERRAAQPVDQMSCGSVFKNPAGDFAGRLIEAAGLKGERKGGAQISSLHANFIVNLGKASSDDVLSLIERAQNVVGRRFGVSLEPEVRITGEAA